MIAGIVLIVLGIVAAGVLWWQRHGHDWLVYSLLGTGLFGVFGGLAVLVNMGWLWVLLGVGCAVAGMFFFVTRVQYPEYFVTKDASKVVLVSGKMYGVPEMKIDGSVELFKTELAHGKKGLCITRLSSDDFAKKYGNVAADVQWLTAEKDGTLSPQDLEEFSYAINSFVDVNKEKGVVLVDGFTYLVNYHEFMKVLHLFEILKDKISASGSILILPVAFSTLNPQEAKMVKTMVVMV